MGRSKREQLGGGGGSADAGAAAAAAMPANEMRYARTDCGLCKQAMDTEGEEHITGVCTVCKKLPLHPHCATDHLQKILKAEQKGGGGHSSKSLLSMLLVADSRPWELLAAGVGKAPKWHSLRRCIICQEGVMETAERVRPRKSAPAAPPVPAPRPPRSASAPKPAPAAWKPAQPPPRRLVDSNSGAATRMHGTGSSGSVSTFAAEQERLARETARREQDERREAAKARREEQEAERLSRLSQRYDEQIAALMGVGGGYDSSQEGSDGSSVAAWWPAGSALLPLPLPTGSPAAVATPDLPHNGASAGDPPAPGSLCDAGEPGGVAWLPVPQFEGRQEAPPEEIDELLGLMGIE